MGDLNAHYEQPPARMLAGALAHLAQHMENGCPRSAHLAAMLLEQIAADTRADIHLRQHAQQLVEILERDPIRALTSESSPGSYPPIGIRQLITRKCLQ